jgi:hypothetical protein
LGYIADTPQPGAGVDLCDRDAIHQKPAGFRRHQAGQQVDQRTFARSGKPHQSDHLSGFNGHGHLAHGICHCFGIAERNIF